MNTTSYTAAILEELQVALAAIDEAEAEQLVQAILAANQVFVAGAGRSGLMGRAFAMRLMHAGINAYVVGEIVTPGIGAGDLLIIASGSGETESLAVMARKAKAKGAALAAVTLNPSSTIGSQADVVVKLSGVAKADSGSARPTIQPMASLFEQSMLLFYDALILRVMQSGQLDTATMYARHANLE